MKYFDEFFSAFHCEKFSFVYIYHKIMREFHYYFFQLHFFFVRQNPRGYEIRELPRTTINRNRKFVLAGYEVPQIGDSEGTLMQKNYTFCS